MADSREVTYKIGTDTSEAQSNVDRLAEGIGSIETAAGKVATGAQTAASAVSEMGSAGAAAASVAGSAASKAAADFSGMGDGASANFRKMGADADSFGAAFKKNTAEAIKDGQSLAKSFQTGVGGAIAFTEKKFQGFRKSVATGARAIGTAFRHPIQTIRGKLVEALDDSGSAARDLGTQADQTSKDLNNMGETGAKAASGIEKSLQKLIKTFIGFAAIKKGIDSLKQFVSGALDAAKAGESVGARFDAVFAGTQAEEWANTYSRAVNRSTNEVKGFMIQNQVMFRELGMTGDVASELSAITTSLAYDFGNAFKISDADALSAIQSAIQGNSSALLEFGINLDDATIANEAMKLGIATALDELDEATLAQLRMNAILEQSAGIQMAAINQTEGLTNSTKSLKGIWDNFMADAGAKFAPVMEKLFGTIMNAWPKIEPMLMGLVDVLSDGLSEALPIIADLGMTLLPILTDVLGIVFRAAVPLLGLFGDLASQILPPVAAVVKELAERLLPPVVTVIEALLPPLAEIVMSVLPLIMPLVGALMPILDVAITLLSPILDLISALLPPIVGLISTGVTPLISVFSSLINTILTPLTPLIQMISKLFTERLGHAISAIMPIINGLKGIFTGLIDFFKNVFAGNWSAAWESVVGIFRSVWDTMVAIFKAPVNFIIDGINLFLGGLNQLKIPDWVPGIGGKGINIPLIPKLAEGGFTQGLSIAGEKGQEAVISFDKSFRDENLLYWQRAGEMLGAFRQKGTAPAADKSEQLAASSTTNNNTRATSSFEPKIEIAVHGNADSAAIDEMTAKLKAMCKELYVEMRHDELATMTLKNAYA